MVVYQTADFRMTIISQIIVFLLSFWHKLERATFFWRLEEMRKIALFFMRLMYEDFCSLKTKETLSVPEFGYPNYEASDDNLEAQI